MNAQSRRAHTIQRVLVVDDDPDWRSFLCASLADLGYEADEAGSGEEALALLRAHRYRIVLLDVHMPGMSGEEVARRIPRDGARVVFLTAAPAHELGASLREAPRYYLPKGAHKEQLGLLLHSLEASTVA